MQKAAMHIQFKTKRENHLHPVSSLKSRNHLNRGRTSVSAIINGYEIIKYSYDKAKLFAMNFASKLGDKDISYLTFNSVHKLCNISLTYQNI